MSGGFQRFNAAARFFLEANPVPVDDPSVSCAVGPCEDAPVYRVPWPHVGGEVEYCPYHLARYRSEHPDLWERVQNVVDEDLSKFATRGNRFLTFDEVPETLFDDEFQAVALLVDGNALYLEVDPEETGTLRRVDRSLEYIQERVIGVDSLGAFLEWVEDTVGVHDWAAGYGGEAL